MVPFHFWLALAVDPFSLLIPPSISFIFLDCKVLFFVNRLKEKDYELGDVNLEGKYKDWQKKLHPDLVHSKSQQERDFAAEQSARLIDAW
ncbi:hypothetical protein K2173_003982 [Erythroxylum novogranatense]|uniref:Uncharacterized protein n=1 Tax=Erythroxylum novogranatense TaxID=1862640 RepID=A0AAV8SJ90_9ROSI|nr:hypothetical protein K2173_003982 [Erythroxylum novogranatense]